MIVWTADGKGTMEIKAPIMPERLVDMPVVGGRLLPEDERLCWLGKGEIRIGFGETGIIFPRENTNDQD